MEYHNKVDGMCHGDLKPDNVILVEGNHSKLLDFGHSQQVDVASSKRVGTDEYRAPEVLSVYKYSAPTYQTKFVDIFGLGCCFLTVMFKRFPFTRRGPVFNDPIYGFVLRDDFEGFVNCLGATQE